MHGGLFIKGNVLRPRSRTVADFSCKSADSCSNMK